MSFSTKYGKRIETKQTFQALSGTAGKTSIVIWRSDEEYLLDKEFGSIQNTSEVKYAMQIDENGMLVVECVANDGKVLYAKNISSVHEKITKQELEKLIQPYTEIEIKNSPDKSQLVSQLEVNLQGKKVLLYNGDITWLTVDVIVSSDNSYRTMSTGVSLAIKNRGGEEILKEYQKLPMNQTKVLVTNAGKLHAKKVFHAIIDDEGQITPVYELTRNCLEIASKLGYKSIAIPIFGTGALGLDFQKTSQEIYNAIKKFLPSLGLELVVISLPLAENFEKFRRVI
ncbi:MAG: macro domain-containing protein [Leptospiraceae bacterium]|nr:macro domain-containing protein [Leptospiraceae bacterium]